MTIDPYDSTWCPPHTPRDVMHWEMHARTEGMWFVLVRGTMAYEFCNDAGGRAVEIKAYIDGACTHHWRRDPIEGIWPGEYEWQAVAVYGKGLVR